MQSHLACMKTMPIFQPTQSMKPVQPLSAARQETNLCFYLLRQAEIRPASTSNAQPPNNQPITDKLQPNILHNLPHFSTPVPQFSTFLGLILHTSPQRFHKSLQVLPASQVSGRDDLTSTCAGFHEMSTPKPQLPDDQLHRQYLRSTNVNFCKPYVNPLSTDVNQNRAVRQPK